MATNKCFCWYDLYKELQDFPVVLNEATTLLNLKNELEFIPSNRVQTVSPDVDILDWWKILTFCAELSSPGRNAARAYDVD